MKLKHVVPWLGVGAVAAMSWASVASVAAQARGDEQFAEWPLS